MPGCNEKNCTCPNKECENHGKCCACVNFHKGNGNLPLCLRELEKKD